MRVLKPQKLRKHDVIGLVAPASPPSKPEKIDSGVRYLESMGYRVKVGRHVRDVHGYLAGTDEGRAADLDAMFRDPSVKAIFVLRGGYGLHRVLHLLDYRAIRQNPKIVVGYSDLTALQLALWRKIGLVTFSGPMAAVEMCDGMDPYTEEHFWRVLTSTAKIGPLEGPAGRPACSMREGRGTGTMLGGNLSVLCTLLGTHYCPSWQQVILVLEEVGEEPYRIDRMLMHLFHAKVFSSISGLALGQFIDCQPQDTSKPHFTVEQVLEHFTHDLRLPVVADLAYGHLPKKLTLPWGLRARIDGTRGRVELLDGAVV
ncbi:MAG: LD-carboxypeptidase [Bacteroidota bacterium]